MKRWTHAALGCAMVFILAGLAGCSMEPRSVIMHEPGVYKGAKDPLLAMQQQDQVLVDRFRLVQTDR